MMRVTKRFLARKVANDVLNWIFPAQEQLCAVCGRPVANLPKSTNGLFKAKVKNTSPILEETAFGMCLFCLQDAHTCRVDRAVHRLSIPSTRSIVKVYSCLPYDHFIRTLIRSWKYDGVRQLSNFFGSVLVSAWGVELSKEHPIVVPVPSSKDRTKKRGYDHVGLLSENFTAHNHLGLRQALCRLQQTDAFTSSQTSKGRVDRYRDLDGAYKLIPRHNVAGRRVLVVDDIVTTGSTIVHCASLLYEAGAHDVSALVIARVL